MGVVYHANYLVWFEVGRCELLRTIGSSYRELEAAGIMLPVIEAHCEYRSPARYDDEVVVRTQLKNARESMVHFGYELVRAADGLLLAEGETMHVVIDREMKKTPIPEKYMRIFRDVIHSEQAAKA